MPFINFNTKKKVRIWDGITGGLHHSDQLTFAHLTLEKGAQASEHSHVHEQWTHVLSGELEFTLGSEKLVLTSGMAAFIPSNVLHSAKAITACNVIDCFLPVRQDFVELEKNSE